MNDYLTSEELKHYATLSVNNFRNSLAISPLTGIAVSVIGYPHGIVVGDALPVHLTGTLASEYYYEVDGKPVFLIDCRTDYGASGSPVFLSSNGTLTKLEYDDNADGVSYKVVDDNGHVFVTTTTPKHRFVGIYSGRINKNSDIGFVWKEKLIEQICRQTIPFGINFQDLPETIFQL